MLVVSGVMPIFVRTTGNPVTIRLNVSVRPTFAEPTAETIRETGIPAVVVVAVGE